MKVVEKTGKTIDEAVELALQDLAVLRSEVDVVVLEEPNKGLFGILGTKLAKVRVSLKEIELPETREIKKPDIEKNIFNETPEERAMSLLKDIFSAMDLTVQMEAAHQEGQLIINLIGPDLGLLIGRRGETLDALQYLVNLAANRKEESRVRIILDVEGYRKRRESTLQNLAVRLADKAHRKGEDVVLEPMNPHERRIIHTALQENRYVYTFSEGEEPFRKIVISPKK